MGTGRHIALDHRVDAAPEASDTAALLEAAKSGWGTTVRFALLRAVDRWPALMLGASATGVGGLVGAYVRTRMVR